MPIATRTRNHDEIRHWITRRGGSPARIRGHDLPGVHFGPPGGDLVPISWREFFEIFDRNDLEFLRTHDAGNRFNKFVPRSTPGAGITPSDVPLRGRGA